MAWWFAAAALGLPAVGAAPADGDGGPVGPVQGGAGVRAPRSAVRYVAIGLRHGTVLEQLHAGRVDRWREFAAPLGVPGVGYDGSVTGLSADGRTLILSAFPRRYPPRTTRLLILDARRLHVRDRLRLRGYFTVDAVSPDGRWMYLIRYTSRRNLLRYEVRAFDLKRQRLLPRPIVDPREPDEAMRGIAVARTVSNDGRWAYTLYQRPGGAPFVHALDTSGRTAACIDVPQLGRTDLTQARLAVHGPRLIARDAAAEVAAIDRRTFRVSTPSAFPSVHRVAVSAPRDPGGGFPWAELAAAAVLVGSGVVTLRRRLRS